MTRLTVLFPLTTLFVAWSLFSSIPVVVADEPFRPITGQFPPLEKAHS